MNTVEKKAARSNIHIHTSYSLANACYARTLVCTANNFTLHTNAH